MIRTQMSDMTGKGCLLLTALPLRKHLWKLMQLVTWPVIRMHMQSTLSLYY